MTVEGVETQEQQTSLISTGLPMNAQGYCFKAVKVAR
jgi:sensor c-di-GMP phosphodiesterase-like protein